MEPRLNPWCGWWWRRRRCYLHSCDARTFFKLYYWLELYELYDR